MRLEFRDHLGHDIGNRGLLTFDSPGQFRQHVSGLLGHFADGLINAAGQCLDGALILFRQLALLLGVLRCRAMGLLVQVIQHPGELPLHGLEGGLDATGEGRDGGDGGVGQLLLPTLMIVISRPRLGLQFGQHFGHLLAKVTKQSLKFLSSFVLTGLSHCPNLPKEN